MSKRKLNKDYLNTMQQQQLESISEDQALFDEECTDKLLFEIMQMLP